MTETTKTLSMICLVLLITACDDHHPALTSDQIIKETKKCEAAGMRAIGLDEIWSGDTIRAIQCEPKNR
jgi:hypothetical protein